MLNLSNQDLEKLCESIFCMDGGADVCKIGGMRGEFTLRRDEITVSGLSNFLPVKPG